MTREAVVWMLAGALAVGAVRLLAAIIKAVWCLWLEHEVEKDAERHRRYLEVIHRTPKPMSERASQGFHRNGNGGPHAA